MSFIGLGNDANVGSVNRATFRRFCEARERYRQATDSKEVTNQEFVNHLLDVLAYHREYHEPASRPALDDDALFVVRPQGELADD